jgi:Fic family protein
LATCRKNPKGSTHAFRPSEALQRPPKAAAKSRHRDGCRLESLHTGPGSLGGNPHRRPAHPQSGRPHQLHPASRSPGELRDRECRHFANRAEDHADPATKEALRYRTALNEGYEALARKPLSTATAVKICRTIKAAEIDIRSTPGTALLNEATGEVVYTPPEGNDRLRNLLANWEQYIHAADETDPLVKMAVMHYQFEAIHPFTDGNGRTGRILNLLYLVEQQLIDIPVLYLSRSIIRRKNDYYRLLLGVTADGAWEAWILYLVEAIRETALWTTSKIKAIRALLDDTAETIRERLPKLYTRELAELIFVQPYCRIANLVDAGIAKRQTASDYLKQLTDIGLLEERAVGREKLFINPAFLRLLSDRGA